MTCVGESNTTWFWKVVVVTEGGVSAAAVTDINTNGLAGNVILELQARYLSTVETFPLVISTLGSPSNTMTIRPTFDARYSSDTDLVVCTRPWGHGAEEIQGALDQWLEPNRNSTRLKKVSKRRWER